MQLRHAALALAFSSIIASPAHAEDPILNGLKAINNALGKLSANSGGGNKDVVADTTPPSIPSAPAPQAPALSEQQKKQLVKQINPKTKNTQLKAMIAEANPTIEKVLGMTACFYPSTSFGVYQSDNRGPGGFDAHQTWLFPHHDRSQCVNVQRVMDWKMTAKNALAFHVLYVSEQSGESVQRGYEIQKQLDDTWLFNQTYY